ncbi:TRAP-T-associated universal stress protein TeaD [Andreesenia angusta]|uniref:TRAP-T-associated universal stress protein TeaD n=1 Tax=Andreesenia angusta TaxID=39480 RepID=A0A1S1V5U7_9FIRM|nr:universal stress protein [Andreesenia angusta]OHW61770.1 TRAP-T-associated universal stress protein TeaD [Andreesenia angusta]
MGAKKILIPVDGSKRSLDAINMVKSLFSGEELDIHLLHVVEMNYIIQEDVQKELLKVSDNILDKAAELLGDYSINKVSLMGTPYKDIVEYAEKENIDMIVMTRMGLSGLQRYLVGSVTSKVISNTSVPVLIVPEGDK